MQIINNILEFMVGKFRIKLFYIKLIKAPEL